MKAKLILALSLSSCLCIGCLDTVSSYDNDSITSYDNDTCNTETGSCEQASGAELITAEKTENAEKSEKSANRDTVVKTVIQKIHDTTTVVKTVKKIDTVKVKVRDTVVVKDTVNLPYTVDKYVHDTLYVKPDTVVKRDTVVKTKTVTKTDTLVKVDTLFKYDTTFITKENGEITEVNGKCPVKSIYEIALTAKDFKDSEDKSILETFKSIYSKIEEDSLEIHFVKQCNFIPDNEYTSVSSIIDNNCIKNEIGSPSCTYGFGNSQVLSIINYYLLPSYAQKLLACVPLEAPIALVRDTKVSTSYSSSYPTKYEIPYFIDKEEIKSISGLNKFKKHCVLVMVEKSNLLPDLTK